MRFLWHNPLHIFMELNLIYRDAQESKVNDIPLDWLELALWKNRLHTFICSNYSTLNNLREWGCLFWSLGDFLCLSPYHFFQHVASQQIISLRIFALTKLSQDSIYAQYWQNNKQQHPLYQTIFLLRVFLFFFSTISDKSHSLWSQCGMIL